jgi:hypothetical protein
MLSPIWASLAFFGCEKTSARMAASAIMGRGGRSPWGKARIGVMVGMMMWGITESAVFI